MVVWVMRIGAAIPYERNVNRWGIKSDVRVSGKWQKGTYLKRFDGSQVRLGHWKKQTDKHPLSEVMENQPWAIMDVRLGKGGAGDW